MAAHGSHSALLLSTIGLALVACGGADPAETMVSFERVDYYTPTGQIACPEDVEYLNHALGELEAYLGQRPFERISYHVRPDVREPCQADVEACADVASGRIYSRYPATAHEVVHLVADMRGARFALLREGLAEALGDDEPLYNSEENSGAAFDSIPYESLIQAVPESYDVAASYVASMLRDWGVQRFMGFYGSMPPRATLAEFEGLLALEGTSLSEIDARRFDEARAGLHSGVALLRCSASLEASSELHTTMTGTLGCSSVGHRRGLSEAYTLRRVLEVPEPGGTFLVKAEFGNGGAFSLANCGRTERLAVRSDQRGPLMLLGIASLSAGRYSLSMEASDDRVPQRVRVDIEEFSGQRLSPPPELTKLQVKLASGVLTRVPFELTGPRAIRRVWAPGSSAVVRLCSASGCSELLDHVAYEAEPGLYELEAQASAIERPEIEFSEEVRG